MRGVAVAGVALFWLATVVAAALVPGYSPVEDYVSSLAGRGSPVAVLGVAALAALGCAHLATALQRPPDPAPGPWTRVRRGALTVAGAAGLVAAAFRTGCPLGAAGCGFGANDAPPDLADRLHVQAVAVYEVGLVVAMAAVVLAAGPRGFRLLTALAAVASFVLLLQTGGAGTGAWQRAWLAVNTAWLVALVVRVSGAARPAS